MRIQIRFQIWFLIQLINFDADADFYLMRMRIRIHNTSTGTSTYTGEENIMIRGAKLVPLGPKSKTGLLKNKKRTGTKIKLETSLEQQKSGSR
jgi:hypothetical protein